MRCAGSCPLVRVCGFASRYRRKSSNRYPMWVCYRKKFPNITSPMSWLASPDANNSHDPSLRCVSRAGLAEGQKQFEWCHARPASPRRRPMSSVKNRTIFAPFRFGSHGWRRVVRFSLLQRPRPVNPSRLLPSEALLLSGSRCYRGSNIVQEACDEYNDTSKLPYRKPAFSSEAAGWA